MSSTLKLIEEHKDNVYTIIIQNGRYKHPYFRTDDLRAFNQRMAEIKSEVRLHGLPNTYMGLYKLAKDHGCMDMVSKPAPPEHKLGMKNIRIHMAGGEWILSIVKGKEEIILKRENSIEVCRGKYLELMKLYQKDNTLIDSMYNYAITKSKLG